MLCIQENVSVTDEDKINIILREFNFTCRTFTFVMMLKLQLQDYLFQVAVNESEISDILHKLTHLETAAAILNDIAVSTCMIIYVTCKKGFYIYTHPRCS